MQRFPELSMQRNPLRTFCPELYRRQQIVRTRTALSDQRPAATGIQIARDRDNWLPTMSLQRASAITTMTEPEIAAWATNPTSGGTKQCTKVPVDSRSCTNSHSPELRDCNRSLPQCSPDALMIDGGQLACSCTKHTWFGQT